MLLRCSHSVLVMLALCCHLHSMLCASAAGQQYCCLLLWGSLGGATKSDIKNLLTSSVCQQCACRTCGELLPARHPESGITSGERCVFTFKTADSSSAATRWLNTSRCALWRMRLPSCVQDSGCCPGGHLAAQLQPNLACVTLLASNNDLPTGDAYGQRVSPDHQDGCCRGCLCQARGPRPNQSCSRKCAGLREAQSHGQLRTIAHNYCTAGTPHLAAICGAQVTPIVAATRRLIGRDLNQTDEYSPARHAASLCLAWNLLPLLQCTATY